MLSGKDKWFFFIAGIFVFLAFLVFLPVKAATLELAGKADWGTYGYIYFHCLETHTGNLLDEVENLSGAGKYLDPATEAFHFTGLPCEIPYGVEISQSGAFSGYAWNPSLGLIGFEHDGFNPPPNYDFNVNCSGGSLTCTPSNNCIACYNFDNQYVYGWARINYGSGYDWINLNSNPLSVYIETNLSSPILPLAELDLGDLGGTADVEKDGSSPAYPATISFHCRTFNYPNAPDPYCTTYKVCVYDLVLTNLTAPNWEQASACGSSALRAVLRWNRFGGTQTGFDILVSTESDFAQAELNPTCFIHRDTDAQQHTIYGDTTTLDCPSGLAYDTPYYWWLRGYDDESNPTDWVQYENNSINDSDKNLDNNPQTFQTFRHEMPVPSFYYENEPDPIQTNTTTLFTSASLYYTVGNPAGPAVSCGSNCTYLWSTVNSLDTIDTETSNPTEIIFENIGAQQVTLQVTDPSFYSCSFFKNISVNYDLPLWREVKAQ